MNFKKSKGFLYLINFANKHLLLYALVMLIGVFFIPRIAYMAGISPEKIIELTNIERGKQKIDPLIADQMLTQAANDKALAIIKNQVFQHNIGDRKFSAWIKDVGYNYIYAGENLAINFTTSEGVINAWMDSPLHKKNVVNQNFKEIGVAVVKGSFEGSDTTLVVQVFGTPLYRISRLMPYGLDPSFESIYSISDINNEKLLTHTASRYFEPKDNLKPLNYVPAEEAKSTNKLFAQADFNPETITYSFYLVCFIVSIFFLTLYFKLLSRHYRFKL
jgi:hypothetical protein